MLHEHPRILEFSIQQGDIVLFDADVVALKYAQAFYGTDATVVERLSTIGISQDGLRPDVKEACYVDTQGCIGAHAVLLVGVPPLSAFTYEWIQRFAELTLAVLGKKAPATQHLAMTIHGVGFGLDETEAVLAQFMGYLTAIQREQFPGHLQRISLIDKDLDRVQRLRQIFALYLANALYASRSSREGTYDLDIPQLQSTYKKKHSAMMTRTSWQSGQKTEAERVLLDVFAHSKDMEAKEKHIRLTAAINTLLQEAVHEGYALIFHERDGIYLQTASGLLVWLAPACTQDKSIELLVYDRENLSPPQE